MRPIEFRGWAKDQNWPKERSRWLFGDYEYSEKGKHPEMYCVYGYEVIPESIGQFTGMYDKNGVKIFEGDIVQYVGSIVAEIFWCESRAGFYFKAPVLAGDRQLLKGIAEKKLIVVGNAYEGVKK